MTAPRNPVTDPPAVGVVVKGSNHSFYARAVIGGEDVWLVYGFDHRGCQAWVSDDPPDRWWPLDTEA